MPNTLKLNALNKQDAERICSWHYEPPYDCYHFSSWQQLSEADRDFANDGIREQQNASAPLYKETEAFTYNSYLASPSTVVT